MKTAADERGTCFLECARRGRQVLDITFPLSQIIEKGADDHGRAAVAQSGIKQFCDFLRPFLVIPWLKSVVLTEVSLLHFYACTLCPQSTYAKAAPLLRFVAAVLEYLWEPDLLLLLDAYQYQLSILQKNGCTTGKS